MIVGPSGCGKSTLLRWPAAKSLPWGDEPGLDVTGWHKPECTYAYNVHGVVAEVDVDCCLVKLRRYVVVHDCGTVLNPTLVDGQIQGAVAQGVGGALYEEMLYDSEGQPLTGTFMDYLLPTSSEVPPIEIEHLETAALFNPEGFRGAGAARSRRLPPFLRRLMMPSKPGGYFAGTRQSRR